MPARLNEAATETIWARSTINGHLFDNLINFLWGERSRQRLKTFHLFNDPSQIKFDVSLVGTAKSFFVCLKEHRLFTHMTMYNRVIGQPKRSNAVPSVSLYGYPMKEFRVPVSKLEVSHSASFHPVRFLAVQQMEEMMLKEQSEISLGDRQPSPFLKSVQFQKRFVAVIDQHGEFGYLPTPLLQIIAQSFILLAQHCSRIRSMASFGPGSLNQ